MSKNNTIVVISRRYLNGTLLEYLFDSTTSQSSFAISKDGEISTAKKYIDEFSNTLIPCSNCKNLIEQGIVLFPSKPSDYSNEETLVEEVRSFIHRYVDVSPIFEKIATYYVLLTWIYDHFNELPYLRKRGDFGSGKTRFLKTIGSICYKPMFATGGASTASLFHIINKYRGTLLIDEADFQFSDEMATITKILNNGNIDGFPLLRVKKDNQGNFSPIGYKVFGPKIVASRGYYQDPALESRFITEFSSPNRIRKDIPITLPSSFAVESLELRNKLLTYRFRNLGKRKQVSIPDKKIDPRINQIFSPLLSVINNERDINKILELARTYSYELLADRYHTVEADVLSAIKHLIDSQKDLSIKHITEQFSLMFSEQCDKKITPKWIGWIVRKKLNLRTHRTKSGYLVAENQKEKIRQFIQRYGL